MTWHRLILKGNETILYGTLNTSFWEQIWGEKLIEKAQKNWKKHKKDQELKIEDSK